jgi:hypothetical protein
VAAAAFRRPLNATESSGRSGCRTNHGAFAGVFLGMLGCIFSPCVLLRCPSKAGPHEHLLSLQTGKRKHGSCIENSSYCIAVGKRRIAKSNFANGGMQSREKTRRIASENGAPFRIIQRRTLQDPLFGIYRQVPAQVWKVRPVRNLLDSRYVPQQAEHRTVERLHSRPQSSAISWM